jgi:CheY-like chemotaxis protein
MRRPVLAVHNDPKIAGSLKEALTSLDWEYCWARSQTEARRRLANTEVSGIFLDLEIPACQKHGTPSVDNGLNLIDQIRANERLAHVPIVASARLRTAKPRLVAWVMRHGATDFIEKPFPSHGDTLCKVLKKAFSRPHSQVPFRQSLVVAPVVSAEPTPFKGGEMVFYPDRVELCGVKIVGDMGTGQSRAILDLLKQRRGDGRYVNMGGEALAKKINAESGIATVTGCVRTIRQSATQRLREKMNLVVGNLDVVTNDGRHGYNLREWIMVRDGVEG